MDIDQGKVFQHFSLSYSIFRYTFSIFYGILLFPTCQSARLCIRRLWLQLPSKPFHLLLLHRLSLLPSLLQSLLLLLNKRLTLNLPNQVIIYLCHECFIYFLICLGCRCLCLSTFLCRWCHSPAHSLSFGWHNYYHDIYWRCTSPHRLSTFCLPSHCGFLPVYSCQPPHFRQIDVSLFCFCFVCPEQINLHALFSDQIYVFIPLFLSLFKRNIMDLLLPGFYFPLSCSSFAAHLSLYFDLE